jgi:predicted Zn-dependent protease
LLIPHNSAGVLIGKGGAIIKQMIDRSQCRMQMGEEADPYHTNERVFVLNASSTNALAAVGDLIGVTTFHRTCL